MPTTLDMLIFRRGLVSDQLVGAVTLVMPAGHPDDDQATRALPGAPIGWGHLSGLGHVEILRRQLRMTPHLSVLEQNVVRARIDHPRVEHHHPVPMMIDPFDPGSRAALTTRRA